MIAPFVANSIVLAAPVDDAIADAVSASLSRSARSPKSRKSQYRTVAAHAAAPGKSEIMRSCGNADSQSSEAGLGPRMAAFESAPPPVPSLRLLSSDSRLRSKDAPPKSDDSGVVGAPVIHNMSKKRSNNKKSTGTRLEVSAQTDISGACDIFQMFREIEIEKLRKRLSKAKTERNFERRNRELLQEELDLAVTREEEATASCTSLSVEAHGLMHELWDMLAVAEAERQSANTRLETSSMEMRSKFENVVAQRQALENYCRLHRVHLDETLDAHGQLGRLHYDLESRMAEHHRNFESQAMVLQEHEETNAFERMREQELHRRYEFRVAQEHEFHRSFESQLADIANREEHNASMLKQECSEVRNNHMTNILRLEEDSRKRSEEEANRYTELLEASMARLEEESQYFELHRANLGEENHKRLEEEEIRCLELQHHNDELKEKVKSNRDAERQLRKRLSNAEAQRLSHWQETHDANEAVHDAVKSYQDLRKEYERMLLEEKDIHRLLEAELQEEASQLQLSLASHAQEKHGAEKEGRKRLEAEELHRSVLDKEVAVRREADAYLELAQEAFTERDELKREIAARQTAMQKTFQENAELKRECAEQRKELVQERKDAGEETRSQYVELLRELQTTQTRLKEESHNSSQLRNKASKLEEEIHAKDDNMLQLEEERLELEQECMDLQQRLDDCLELQNQFMNVQRLEVESRIPKKEDAPVVFSHRSPSTISKDSSMASGKRASFSKHLEETLKGVNPKDPEIARWAAEHGVDLKNQEKQILSEVAKIPSDAYLQQVPPKSTKGYHAVELGRVDEQPDPELSDTWLSGSSQQERPRFSSSPRLSSPHQGHVFVDLHDDEPERPFHPKRYSTPPPLDDTEIPRAGSKVSLISTPQSDHGSYWGDGYRESSSGATTVTRISMKHAMGHGPDTKATGAGRLARRYQTGDEDAWGGDTKATVAERLARKSAEDDDERMSI